MMKNSTKYIIAKYDYFTKRNTAINWFTDRLEALDAIFIYAVSYLEVKDGHEKIKDPENHNSFMFDKHKFRTTLKSTLTPGHYIIRDPDTHVYKLEIWQKSIEK